MSENPYAPPSAGAGPEADYNQRPALREIVVAWEKLRLWYNAILAIPGVVAIVGWVGEQGMPLSIALIMAVMVAVGANFCFLLGPVAELYLRGLFRQGQPLGRGRLLIFGAGVVVSLGVFAVAMAGGWLV
ncbi:hypothetical protein OKA05_19915 [Luteolibacter arcticus]|uniref:Transmembrane protein n=1 Tax=Luteolibacter arcticus TaxID=1581411 RepID=A0ABT3GMU4_9BACT|nr:hypothetical protein [Luteolibacter arcticus]MCW1924841.1 hypothetical protein [Luteolibacter arcticus]